MYGLNNPEPFIVSGRTLDGHSYAICGICREGSTDSVVKAYESMNSIVFGSSKDPFFIDIRLEKLVNTFSQKDVFMCGASINIRECVSEGGGLIGPPYSPSSSAEDNLEKISDTSWIVSYGGYLGAYFECDEEKAITIEKEISCILGENEFASKETVMEIESLIAEKSSRWLLISDGCGRSQGCAAFSFDGKKEIKWICD